MKAAYDPKPKFRNTRSKFFKKTPSDEFNTTNSEAQKNTGTYWKNLGNQAYKEGNIQKALEHYSKAIELNGSESIFFSNRSKCYKLLKKYSLALKDAEEACELDDTNIKAHHHCGCLLAEMAKTEPSKLSKAENRLKKALRLCSTLGKMQYADDISIKLFRVRKLKYYLEEAEKQNFLKEQQQLMKTSLQKGIIDTAKYDKMVEMFQKTNKVVVKEIPDWMLCKITLDMMEDPVSTEAGFTYERTAIEDHLRTNGNIEPITRKAFTGALYSNIALKAGIEAFLEENPWAFQFEAGQEYFDIQF